MKSPQHHTKQFKIDKAVTPWSELTRKQRDEIRACEDWQATRVEDLFPDQTMTQKEFIDAIDAIVVVDSFITEMITNE